ncbi:hypothetical protein [Paenibacillus larvae]|uniref:Phage protein n=1 Tax=Paenibacillus larvae subsp. larvae DSM 25430 TaxID=697284 RepID=V9W5Z5_9BACL|nr:hypothetical protein [Paenibacillus larvae]AHD06436.1 hypothetical protein ERIC2_c26490 [Paenibacillus larvae subsp. larvae DSM 25430]AVG12984.1 hypothetical protein ERICII_02630 [Paenibacillus larvae subsp. larvae DSM 25430]MDR5569021.1 hypothetical protein [Paenibacillus larvae]MDR5596704.1 hypothetical protein [Paenibacillus larvae]
MRELIKKAMRRTDVVKLGKHQVKIAKITPKKWREMVECINVLPQIIENIRCAPPEDFTLYVMNGLEVASDDIVRTVSVLTGIEIEELDDTGGIGMDQLIEYLRLTYEYNNIDDIVKNVKRLLPMPTE